MNMKFLQICKLIQKCTALTEEDAETLFPHIKDAIQKNGKIVISFYGIQCVSTLFLRTLLSEIFAAAVEEVVLFEYSNNTVIENQIERIRRRMLKPDEYLEVFDKAIAR